MKILHITASYKPAYVYGGPVMSVAKLCEEVSKVESKKLKVESRSSKVESWKSEVRGPKSGVRSQRSEDRGPKSEVGSLQSDINITVYTTLANGKDELPYRNGEVKILDGVKVNYFKRITKDHSHLSPTLLWHLWKTVKRFDVVQIHAWWNLVTMPACFIAVFRGVKVILTPRGTLSSYSFEVNNSRLKGLFHQYFGKFLLNRTYFHCTSIKEVEDTQKLLNPKAIFNLPNFVELPFEYQDASSKKQDASSKYQDSRSEKQEVSSKKKDDILKLIFLSRVDEKKGLALLFDCLAQLDFNWELTIVGDGELGYIESLKWKVESAKLGDKVKWIGPVYGENKFELLAQHDYLVLPSFDENFANVVIESLFVGTPVLVTENVGLSDYVKENNLGYVCVRTKTGLVNLLLSAQKAKNMKVFKRSVLNSVVVRDFDETALTTKYLNMYNSVIDN